MVMDLDATSYKILLLVDLDSCVHYDAIYKCTHGTSINAVRVAALKLLHFYLCHANGKNIPFQWSYKIYTRDKQNIQNVKRQSCFQDLNLTNFEAFESNIECDYSFLNSNGTSEAPDDPCDSLGHALQDVAVFFPWTITELQSPVRRRSVKQNAPIQQGSGNLVFLFSICPQTATEIQHFAGKNVQDAVTLLESFAAPELQRKLADLCCVTFIDLRSTFKMCHFNKQDTEENGVNHSKEELMKRAFGLMKGKFLPVSSILCLKQPQLCHISNFVTKEPANTLCQGLDTPLFATSTTLGGYIHSSQHTTTMTSTFILGCHGHTTALDVDIVDLVNNKKNCLVTSVLKRSQKKIPSLELHGNKLKTSRHIPISTTTVSVCNSSPQKTMNSPDICVKVVGVVLYTESDLRHYSSEEMYMVTPQTHNIEAFIKHMSYFTKHNMLQVCEVSVQDSTILTALIQPLTASSSLLSIIPAPHHHSLPLQQAMIPLSTKVTHTHELNAFVRRSVEHISRKKMARQRQRPHQVSGQAVCEGDGEAFSTGLLEDYYMPGSLSYGAQSLHKQIQLDSEVSDGESETMRLLQKNYQKHKSRRLTDKKATRSSPRKALRNKSKSSCELAGSVPTAPVLRRSPRKKPSSGFVAEDESAVVPMLPPPALPPKHPLRRSRSHTAPTRRDVLWNKCRDNMAKQKHRESTPGVASKKLENEKPVAESSASLVTEELQSREELVDYLHRAYEDILSGSSGVLSAVHTLINISLHFTQTQKLPNPQQTACDIMAECLTKSVKEIKTRNQDDAAQTYRELEMQLLLQMELETMLRDGRTEDELEGKAEQLAALIRGMSFSHQAGFNVSDYLGKQLLDSYVETLPLLLGKLYEEFLLPLPHQLDSLFSPELSNTTSVSSHMPGSLLPPSVGSNSSELPPSNRPRREKALKRYTSFHSVSNRQIQLPQQEKKEAPRRSARTASAVKAKAKASKVQPDVQKISKNLFGIEAVAPKKLERSKSMSVMEKQSVRKTPKKNSGKTSQKTPKVHHVLKSRRVLETPSHKQRSKSVWSRQEKARRRTMEAVPVQSVEESPGKALLQANKKTPKKTPKKGALMKRKSFYSMTDDARDKFEKLEARMKNKILSPTWNESRRLSSLTTCMTSPRRVQPRTLFSSLRSPSPRKPPSSLKTPDRKTRVSSQLALNSPGFNTRSQISERKKQQESTKTETLTPRKKVKMNLFQSPNAGQAHIRSPMISNMQMQSPLNITPKKKTSLTFMSPIKHPQNGKCSVGIFAEPMLPFKKPSNILNSPGGVNIKGILSPAKRTPKKHASLGFGSPLRFTPKKNVVLNLPESPFPVKPGQDLLDQRVLSPLRQTPVRNSSNKLVFSSPRNNEALSTTVSQSPKPSSRFSLDASRPLTRSASKLFPENSAESTTPAWKARANLSSLFSDDANDGFGLSSSRHSDIGIASGSSGGEASQSSTISATDKVPEDSSENCRIQRRTLSSQPRRRATRKLDGSVTVGNQASEQASTSFNIQVKRKHSPDGDTAPVLSPRKRRRSSVYDTVIPQTDQTQQYLDSDEVFLGASRASEKPSTKSTLCSDQSNSRISAEVGSPRTRNKWACMAQLQDLTNCDSNLSVKSLPAMHMNINEESLDSVDSPVFETVSKENLCDNQFMGKGVFSVLDDKNKETTSLFKGVMKKHLQQTLSTHTDSSMSGAPSPVFDIPVSTQQEPTQDAPVFSRLNVNSSKNNLPKPNIKSPLKLCPNSDSDQKEETPPKSKSPGTTPQRLRGRHTPGKSPSVAGGRMTPMCSPPGSTKYSPLTSTKSLVMLMESPLLAHSGGKCRRKHMAGTPTSHTESHQQVENVMKPSNVSDGEVTESRRQTRRSLYRTQTNQSLS